MLLGIVAGVGPNSSYKIFDRFSRMVLGRTGRLPYFNSISVDGVDFVNIVYCQGNLDEKLINGLENLYSKSDSVAVLCNTFYASDFFRSYSTNKKTIHLPRMCCEYLSPLLTNQKVGVVGTKSTIDAGLYSSDKFNNRTIKILTLPLDLQSKIDSFLSHRDNFFPDQEIVNKFLKIRNEILSYFKSNHCSTMLLACTDLDELFQDVGKYRVFSTRIIFAELLSDIYCKNNPPHINSRNY